MTPVMFQPRPKVVFPQLNRPVTLTLRKRKSQCREGAAPGETWTAQILESLCPTTMSCWGIDSSIISTRNPAASSCIGTCLGSSVIEPGGLILFLLGVGLGPGDQHSRRHPGEECDDATTAQIRRLCHGELSGGDSTCLFMHSDCSRLPGSGICNPSAKRESGIEQVDIRESRFMQ